MMKLILLRIPLQTRNTHSNPSISILSKTSHSDSLRFACGAPKTHPMHSQRISCSFDCKMVKAHMNRLNLTIHPNGSKTIDGLFDVKVRVC